MSAARWSWRLRTQRGSPSNGLYSRSRMSQKTNAVFSLPEDHGRILKDFQSGIATMSDSSISA